MVSHNDCLWGKEFFDTYFKHAEKRSFNNRIIHQAAAISLIGQSMRDVRLESGKSFIDCRIHPFVIQSSGTGKNSAFNFMSTVATEAGMEFKEHGKDSTAGIMGTVSRNGDAQFGDLSDNGFVAWKEAQQLIKASKAKHSSDLLEVINQAIDPSGRVSRALSGGELSYNSRTSLFATTYPPEVDESVDLVHQGFLPRTLFIYRRWDNDEYDQINQMRDDRLPRENDNREQYRKDFEDDVEKLANTLKYIEDTVWKYGDVLREDETPYAQSDEHIDFFEHVEDGVRMQPELITEPLLDEYSYKVREIARPFKTRLYDTIYKISACLAAVDKNEDRGEYVSRVIKERHVKNARKIVKKSWGYILEFISDYMVNTMDTPIGATQKAVYDICKNDSGMASVREVMIETGKKKTRVKEDLATLSEMGKIEAVNKTIHTMNVDDLVTIDTSTNPWDERSD